MQDRVIGPLTMTQFILVVIGAGFSYSIWTTIPSPFGLILALPLAILTFCIGFIKINERPFWVFLFSIFGFLGSPRQRVWRHDPTGSMRVEIYTPNVQANTPSAPTKVVSHEQIANVAKQADKSDL